jgi:D-methionine transport system ATP-binding protein
VALADVTLKVGQGERVAFIGPSGAGKTTLFRILNLTLRPTGGDLRVDGADVARLDGVGLRALRRRVGTVYQQHNSGAAFCTRARTSAGAATHASPSTFPRRSC